MKAKPSFAAFCRDILGEPISPGWDVAYRAGDGLPLETNEVELFWRPMSCRQTYEPRQYREKVFNKGRRAQGTRTACKRIVYMIAVFASAFKRFAPKTQRLHVPVIAQTRDIAREIVAYFTDFYTTSPLLQREVAEITKHQIELKNRFIISVGTCSYRAPRGITSPLALCDEIGMWRVEGTDVDREVIRSLTPAMVQFPFRELLILGSPWKKAGVLHERWQNRFENNDRLVLHCPTPLMNPLISAEELEREQKLDESNYRREFLAEWPSDDIDALVPDSDIDAAVQSSVRELPPVASLIEANRYVSALDASGLGGGDRFTFGVAHGGPDSGTTLDCLRSWAKAPVPQVMDEIAVVAKSYGIRSIVADQYSFPFIRELLEQRGLEVRQLAFSVRSKPELFLDMKLWFAQARIRLLDHAGMLRELRMLESKRTSGGRYSISAPRGQHDDFCALLALLVRETKAPGVKPWVEFFRASADPDRWQRI